MRHPFLRTLAGSGVTTDPNFENVTLLLHGDGTNGGQNNTFVDGSTNNFTITRNGNTTQGTFSPYGDNWSNRFDGTGDYLSIGANAAFDFGTGNFTIEAWVYIAGNSALDGNGNRPGIIFAVADSVYSASFIIDGNSSTTGTGLVLYGPAYSSVAGTITQNTWHHLAVSKSGTSVYFWLNGTQLGTTQTTSGSWGSSTKQAQIGQSLPALYTFPLNGYISNLRVLKGTALYTSAFTPPTAPLTAITNTSLLTCQSNRFRDASTNNFTITRNGDVSVQRFSPFSPTAAYAAGTIGGSGYFDGTGDFLSAAYNSAFDITSGDFCAEAWVYRTVAGAEHYILSQRQDSPSRGWELRINSGNTVTFLFTGGSFLTSTTTIPAATWTHLAATRQTNTFRMFINGALEASSTFSNGTATTSQLYIGSTTSSPQTYAQAYISDARIVKGSAVYTAAFTPPSAPLTAITNTSLLLNFTNAAIRDNAMMAVPETVGNAQISTSVKKYGTGSMAFDGTGDYLQLQNNPALAFGTGDFTIEFWLYLNSQGDYQIYDSRVSGGEVVPVLYTSGGQIRYYVTADRITGATLAATTWYHIALCRSGTSTKLFVDGTQSGSTYTDNNNYLQLAPYIGVYKPLGIVYLNGYIDDLRITKGVARYTSNFTAPTAAFPDL